MNDKKIRNIIKSEQLKLKDEEFANIMQALDIKDKKERYIFLYDRTCEYLDSFFYEKNYCDFRDNKCGEKRTTNSTIGCCRHYKNKFLGPFLIGNKFVKCEYLGEDCKCSAKCLSCKLYTCDYLEKKGVKFNIDDIPYLYLFFNPIQKWIIKTSVYTTKEKIIKKLLKYSF